MTIDTPYNEFSISVRPDWIDDNGHLNVAFYHHIFDLSAEPFFHWLGFTPEQRQAHNFSTFALETHLNYLSEVKVNTLVRIESRLLDVHKKRIHFYQEMVKADTGVLAASHEALGTIVDMSSRKSCAMPDHLLDRLRTVKSAHASLPTPWQIGHVMSVDPKNAS